MFPASPLITAFCYYQNAWWSLSICPRTQDCKYFCSLHSSHVPKPYNLLTHVPRDASFFSALDLKDEFFCISLQPSSQFLFAFKWRGPNTKTKTKQQKSHPNNWIRLPRGFINNSHMFGRVLETELREIQLTQTTFLQYADNLLIASLTLKASQTNTLKVL